MPSSNGINKKQNKNKKELELRRDAVGQQACGEKRKRNNQEM